MEYFYKYSSFTGDIFITADDNYLLYVGFSLKRDKEYKQQYSKNFIIEETIKQLDEYFNLKRKSFDLPLNPIGTDFQKKIWNELRKIPYGETRTYKEIAAAIGNNKSARAVGNANNRNPISIIIPCHRVIGSDNKLTGYAGGVDKKQKLLELERSNLRCNVLHQCN